MPSILHLLTRAFAAQKSVFAHVVVGNTAAHSVDTWTQDIKLAASSGIDAFVLNMGYPDPNIPQQVSNAFAAAEKNNFKLFFAFDYLGGGQPWPATGDKSVTSYLNQYKNSKAYFRYQNKPFVSTFEGVNNIWDWAQGGPIRSSVGDIYFVPDWTSLGPEGIKSHLDKIEGAFSWDMWPKGPNDMNIGTDQAWKAALGSKSYMMGVSPWFFRSADGGKNWIWNGDNLWAFRWSQTSQVDAQFVQIVTWNDYGESHYIAPVRDQTEIPRGSGPYVNGMPHDSWLNFLPYYISTFKGNSPDIPVDRMQYWYRNAPVGGGSSGSVVGNNGNQGQQEVPANSIVSDGVFFTALLKAPAEVRVQIGNAKSTTFYGSRGINHWAQLFNGQTGQPKFTIVRNANTVGSGTGKMISPSTTMANGLTNYNAWVGGF